MSLFDTNPQENLLPYDGTANYFGAVIAQQDADDYFQKLLNFVAWRQDEVIIYGKRYVTRRKTAWYGDAAFIYTYSGTTRTALPLTSELAALKKIAERHSGATYNSCLLNLYHDGSDGMSWHSDDEKMLLQNAPIASMSFGAQRKFSFKHKQTKETRSIMLEHGSLLVMKDEIQQHWLHALPKSKKVNAARINLTFRTIA